MISVRTWKLYIAPFLVIGLILAYEYLQTSILKFRSFASLAQNSSALIETQKKRLTQAHVVHVIDGDTIEIDNGQKIRYIGIDTPETKHPRKKIECFGLEAARQNKALVEGKTIYLEKDLSEKDAYGRLLRYVYLPNPEASDEALFVNEYLVEQGFAYLLTYPPDIKYNTLIRDAQIRARNAKTGLWKKCN